MAFYSALLALCMLTEPATPKPVPSSPPPAATPAPATTPSPQSEAVSLRPVYQAGDTIKIRWTTDNVDVREGANIAEKQKRSTSHCQITFTVKIEEVFPDRVYRCSANVDRVVIEAPTMGGEERYDSSDPATAGSVFSGAARILMAKPLEFAVSGQTNDFFRKEHPRLRTWYADGVNLLDNTFGDQAFPARFGVLFGWRTDEAGVGQEWKDTLPIRVNTGYPIITDRTFTLLDNNGVTMNIGIKGKGTGAPESAARSQVFRESTYDAKYLVNTASAKIREGQVNHSYTADYTWQGAPATVTSTVLETIERLE